MRAFHLMERKEDCGLERRHGMITQWTAFFLGLFTITVIITCVICANANMPGGGWRSLSLRCTISRQRQRDGLAGCWLELGTTGRDGRSKKKEEVLHVPIKSRCKLN